MFFKLYFSFLRSQSLINSLGRVLVDKYRDDWEDINKRSGGAPEVMKLLEQYLDTIANNMLRNLDQPFDIIHDDIGKKSHLQLCMLRLLYCCVSDQSSDIVHDDLGKDFSQ